MFRNEGRREKKTEEIKHGGCSGLQGFVKVLLKRYKLTQCGPQATSSFIVSNAAVRYEE